MEECLICKSALKYSNEDTLMECCICHKKEKSKTSCINGHYVCNECHTEGLESIFTLCLEEKSKNPIEIIEKMMNMPFCHMHGPEHHVMVGAALLTAYNNVCSLLDLEKAIIEMYNRGKQVPGGTCGFWGACGAGLSTGMYMSIITDASPLTENTWALANQMTAKALENIGKVGGPRCCKRDSYLAIMSAVEFTKEKLGVEMQINKIVCHRKSMNKQCIAKRCPFSGLTQ